MQPPVCNTEGTHLAEENELDEVDAFAELPDSCDGHLPPQAIKMMTRPTTPIASSNHRRIEARGTQTDTLLQAVDAHLDDKTENRQYQQVKSHVPQPAQLSGPLKKLQQGTYEYTWRVRSIRPTKLKSVKRSTFVTFASAACSSACQI